MLLCVKSSSFIRSHETVRIMINDQLTGAVDARRPDARVVFALAEDLVEHLFLLFAKVYFGIVGTG